ncbi:MAG: energy transducer TonB [Bacteroidales bacterium]
MKKNYKLFPTLVIFGLLFCLSNSFAQQNETYSKCKSGIAIVQDDENGNHTIPTSATAFPEFEGGVKEMYKFIYSHTQYPENLKRQNISGITTVEFMVHADGSISDPVVVKSSEYQEFDDEAIRIVNTFPHWQPAKINCEPVDMKAQIKIEFKLSK